MTGSGSTLPDSTFPGGTLVSRLDVYGDAAPDGICGGSPHLHTVSTEAYIVISGHGALQSLSADGFRETPLEAGAIVWFTPGVIHRAVNHGELQAVVLMSNSGLPEAGDAVMTFPPEHLADAQTYAETAALREDPGHRAERAARRRDLAVEGFLALKTAVEAGDSSALTAFYEAAGAIVRERAQTWPDLVRRRPLATAEASLAMAQAVASGDLEHLLDARVQQAVPAESLGFGMCGRLRTYDVTDQA